ncbi:MAG: T9SS type A sorting domain-containing protein [Bacteroidia bacterium]|nr:T9SS type A sorting domain-containing protein [Bacteroidia bacterium]
MESVAQTFLGNATVYTPKGTAVPALRFSEFNSVQIANVNSAAAAQFPNAQRIANASATYNCHGYAWYLSESPISPRYWINTPGDDTYWNDGSYIRVCNASEGTKISYASDDHSAVRSAVAGKFESKWGQWPLLRHDPTYTPYNSSVLHYYASTKINGSTLAICSGTRAFSVSNITGATYTWTASSNISIVSGAGTRQVTVQRNGSSIGTATLTVQISTPCSGGSASNSISFPVGKEPISALRMPQTYFYGPGASVYGEVDPVPGATTYEWYLNGQFQQISSYNHEFVLYSCGNYTLGVRAYTSACGWTDISSAYFTVGCSGSFMVYPNPAQEQITIEQVSNQDSVTYNQSTSNLQIGFNSEAEDETFSVKLYNAQQEVVAEGRTSDGKEKKIKLSVSKLHSGTYYLFIYYKESVLERQIVVQ